MGCLLVVRCVVLSDLQKKNQCGDEVSKLFVGSIGNSVGIEERERQQLLERKMRKMELLQREVQML